MTLLAGGGSGHEPFPAGYFICIWIFVRKRCANFSKISLLKSKISVYCEFYLPIELNYIRKRIFSNLFFLNWPQSCC